MRRTGCAATGLMLAVLTAVAAAPPGLAAPPPGLAAASPGWAANGSGTTGPRPGVIEWAPCPQDVTAECGVLPLPVDWANPNGQRFDLAVARRKATDPAARIGSLLINPGGPGGSGVDFAIFGAGYFSDEITRRFDLVGFDPRGVGRSNPVTCSLELLGQAPPPVLASQGDFDRLVDHNGRLAADCRARTGPLFDHVDTSSVVRDIDAIRAAVGDRQLSYYGLSYGTLAGQRYAEMFPDRVRALVLDGNLDRSLGVGDFLRTQAVTAQDSFDEFVRGCTADPRCALHGRDIHALWADLLARAGRGELADPYDPARRLAAFDLVVLAFSSFYGPDWFDLADHLAKLDAARAQPAGPGDDGARVTGLVPAVAHPFPAVFCQDWALPIRDYAEFATYAGQSAYLAPDLGFSPLALTAVTSCLGWPTPVRGPQHPPRGPDDASLLLVNSLHDPATGYAGAVATARQLGPRAALLTYEGWGHGGYGASECVTAAIDRYLISGEPPAAGTRCPAVAPEPPAPGWRPLIRSLPPGPVPTVPGWRPIGRA